MKTKREALAAVHQISHEVGGQTYKVWSVYLGTDKTNHRKIAFQRASKAELLAEIDEFYLKTDTGASPSSARDMDSASIADYLLARKVLSEAGFRDVSLCEAARAYCRQNGGVKSTSLSAAYARYLDSFSEEQTTQRGIVNVRVGKFVSAAGPDLEVSSVGVSDVKGYLERSFGNSAPKTWNNVLSYLSTFFAWCARPEQAFCRENPAAKIARKTIAWHEPEFVRADTVRTLFDLAASARDRDLAAKRVWFLALSFFCGVRSAEAMRLAVSDINLAEGWLRIAKPKGVTRGVPPRLVYLTDAAKAWMSAFPVPVAPSPDALLLDGLGDSEHVYAALRRAAQSGGIALDVPHNAGRHSFITMHVALHGDPRKTEAMVGTSASMRVNHYQGLATKKEAEEYFSVLPRGSATTATA